MPDPSGLLQALRGRTAKIVVIGQGYVGLPLALRSCLVGFPVIGYDTDDRRVASLSEGRSYVGDISDLEVQSALMSGYRPSADPDSLQDFDVAVVTVPTPLLDGKPDLGFIESAARMLGRYARRGCCIVLESTTYPGTTEEFVGPIVESVGGLRAGEDYFLGYSPERVDPGNRVWTIVNTPKLVSGLDADSLEVVDVFYASIVDTTVRLETCAEAEMAKLLENTFRHVNIALINELAVFAHQLGVDIWRVVDAASTKPFGFMRFTPGPGVGGHCLPVDPSYLAWRIEQQTGAPFKFVALANEVNSSMPAYVVERSRQLLALHGKELPGARVLLLGLSFKKGTSDCRESPSMHVAEMLLAEGAAVRAADPYVAPLNLGDVDFELVSFTVAEVAAADLVLLLVDHPEFVPGLIANHARLVLDTKGSLRGAPFTGEVL